MEGQLGTQGRSFQPAAESSALKQRWFEAFAILKPALASNSYDPTVSPASQQAAIQVWITWQRSRKG
jgi:hypothetical protein